jgi:hypothetical protein
MKHIYFVFVRPGTYTTEVRAIVCDPRRDQTHNRIRGRWETHTFPENNFRRGLESIRQAIRKKTIDWRQE